ncbi:ATP-binding protein [Chitinivorax sp. B]|uniref:ATP-binding protein n=1 Tax=Chitinivorax sp. B TaxID=2502235 RepID=UPI0010FA0AD9|nr:ATP-binding protein [Chitinivorax sp. B]
MRWISGGQGMRRGLLVACLAAWLGVAWFGFGLLLDRIYDEATVQSNEEFRRMMHGPITLIEKALKPYPLAQWPTVLAGMQHDFDYRLAIQPLDQMKLPHLDHARLVRGEITLGEDQDMVLHRVAGSRQVLVLGPIWITPARSDYPRYVSVHQLIAAFILALIGFLWIVSQWLVAPARRDHRRLQEAMSVLAGGDLSVQLQAAESRRYETVVGQFNRMTAGLRSLIEQQREVSRAVSHELRTPLARFRFGLALLEDELPAAHGKHATLAALQRATDELESLIESALVYARMSHAQQPAIRVETHDLMAWIRQELSLWPQTGIRVVLNGPDQPLMVPFDALQLRHAFRNLLANACRFARSEVTLTVSRQDDEVALHVHDDGPGVPAGEETRIFEPFVRGSRPNGAGHGLGLAIAARIMALHGGQIGLKPGVGAHFYLQWPV